MSEPFAEQVDLKAFERLFTVNFYQCLWVCHAALPHLIKSKGRIVNVSSIAGKTYLPNRTAYCSSKNAMIAFFDCLRLEVRDAGIKITTVCPGTVDTDIGSRRVSSDGSIGKRKDTDLDVSKVRDLIL
jgi:NAD(P)-dependent dehydrogenase (short-subunit alcohol dehydrogenase family)